MPAPGDVPVPSLSAAGYDTQTGMTAARTAWAAGQRTAEEIVGDLGQRWDASRLRDHARREGWGPNLADMLGRGRAGQVEVPAPPGAPVEASRKPVRKATGPAPRTPPPAQTPEEVAERAERAAARIWEHPTPPDQLHPALRRISDEARAALEGEVLKEMALRLAKAVPADIVQRHKVELCELVGMEGLLQQILAAQLARFVSRMEREEAEGDLRAGSAGPERSVRELTTALRNLADTRLKRIIIERQIWQLDIPGGPLGYAVRTGQAGQVPEAEQRVIYLPSPDDSLVGWAAKAQAFVARRAADAVVDVEAEDADVVDLPGGERGEDHG